MSFRFLLLKRWSGRRWRRSRKAPACGFARRWGLFSGPLCNRVPQDEYLIDSEGCAFVRVVNGIACDRHLRARLCVKASRLSSKKGSFFKRMQVCRWRGPQLCQQEPAGERGTHGPPHNLLPRHLLLVHGVGDHGHMQALSHQKRAGLSQGPFCHF